eukprot:g9318.t1
MESNKNRNTWANHSTKGDQDEQLREGVIFRAARASYTEQIRKFKNQNNYMYPAIVESYLLSQKVSKKIKIGFSLSRATKIFLYHLFFPLSVPLVYIVGGKSSVHLFKFNFNHVCSCSIWGFGNIVHILSSILAVLTLMTSFQSGAFILPCSSLYLWSVCVALSIHFVRVFMVALKYAFIPEQDYKMMLKLAERGMDAIWQGVHLYGWAFGNSSLLNEEIQVTILREGIDAKRWRKSIETSTIDQSTGNKLAHEDEIENLEHNNDRFIFTFCIQIDERSMNSSRKMKEFISRATMKRKLSRVYSSIRSIAEFERAEIPSVIEQKIKRIFVLLKGKGQYIEKDYNDFRSTVHFQLQKGLTEKSNDYFYKCILAVDAREVIRRSFEAPEPMFSDTTLGRMRSLIPLCLTIAPWIISILESEAGIFYSSPESTVVPLYGNECVNGSSVVGSLHPGCPCNYYNLSVYDQLFYSVPETSSHDIHGTLVVFSTVIAIFTGYVLISTAVTWLLSCMFIYYRQHKAMAAFDGLIARDWIISKEQTNHKHPGRIESKLENCEILPMQSDGNGPSTSLYAQEVAPTLMLNTISNIRSYIYARKVLKKMGIVYYYRAQIYAALLLLVLIGLTCLSLIESGYEHAIIGAAMLFFLIIAAGVLKIIHFGAESNDQVKRAIQYLHRQRAVMVEGYGRKEAVKSTTHSSFFQNYQEMQPISIALDSAANLLEEEWSRQPINVFGIPAGRAVYGLIGGGIVSGVGIFIRGYIGNR